MLKLQCREPAYGLIKGSIYSAEFTDEREEFVNVTIVDSKGPYIQLYCIERFDIININSEKGD